MFNLIKTNLQIIRVVTSCDKNQYKEFIDNNIGNKKLFYKKRYIWNILRGRDFYRTISWYIATLMNSKDRCYNDFSHAEFLIHIIIKTAKNDGIRESFISNLTKQVPILTVDMLQYMTPGRLYALLDKEKMIIADRYISSFIEKLVSKQAEIESLKNDINVLNSIINE